MNNKLTLSKWCWNSNNHLLIVAEHCLQRHTAASLCCPPSVEGTVSSLPTLGSCLLTFLHDTQWDKGWLHSTSLLVTTAETWWSSYWNETIGTPVSLRNCQHYWHCEDERVTEIFFPHFKKMSTYYTVCCCWTAWGCFMILNILKQFRNKRQINI